MANMSLEELQTHANLLAKVPLQGLNRDRARAVCDRAVQLHSCELELDVGGVANDGAPFTGMQRLVHAIAKQVGVPEEPFACKLRHDSLACVLSSICSEAWTYVGLVLLKKMTPTVQVWMPLQRGSIIQGELTSCHWRELGHDKLGQLCNVAAWQLLWLTDQAECCCPSAPPHEQTLCMLFVPARHPSPPSLLALTSPNFACQHELHWWGESHHGLGSCSRQDGSGSRQDSHNHRWFKNLPLPLVEPVDNDLLYNCEEDENCAVLDGIRLATLAVIRDQETALARELQTGNKELAKLTAESLTELHQTVDGLEESLCIASGDVPSLYENQGLQNRDVALRAMAPEEGVELLQAKTVPTSEVRSD